MNKFIHLKIFDSFYFIFAPVFSVLYYFAFTIIDSYQFIDTQSLAILFFLLFSAIFDIPHVFFTFMRSHLDKGILPSTQKKYSLLLLVLICSGIICLKLQVLETWYLAFYYIGYFHIAKQNIGLMSVYSQKNKVGSYIDYFLEKWGYLFLFFVPTFSFRQDLAAGSNQTNISNLFAFDFPSELIQVLNYVAILLFGIYLLRQLFNQSQFVPQKFFLFCSTLGLNYWLHSITEAPNLVIMACETLYHNIQYIAWIYLYQKDPKRFVFTPSQKRFIVLALYCTGSIIAIMAYSRILTPHLKLYVEVLLSSIVLFHFIIDGFIWKLSKDHQLKTSMLSFS